MATPDLTSEERVVALRVAQEMDEAHSKGELWVGIQSLRWAVDEIAALAKAGVRYCPGGVPLALPEAFAGAVDLTARAPLPEPPVMAAAGSGRLKLDGLPAGGVLGVIEPETSDGIPNMLDGEQGAPFDVSDEAQTGLVIDHTGPVVMPDGKLGVMKRSVGFPLDSAGGHGRSGEM